jgi:hypothetical protein
MFEHPAEAAAAEMTSAGLVAVTAEWAAGKTPLAAEPVFGIPAEMAVIVMV